VLDEEDALEDSPAVHKSGLSPSKSLGAQAEDKHARSSAPHEIQESKRAGEEKEEEWSSFLGGARESVAPGNGRRTGEEHRGVGRADGTGARSERRDGEAGQGQNGAGERGKGETSAERSGGMKDLAEARREARFAAARLSQVRQATQELQTRVEEARRQVLRDSKGERRGGRGWGVVVRGRRKGGGMKRQ
jgi:hypothetical protein